MFGKIKDLFTKSTPTPPTNDFPIQFAFHCEGVDYFEFIDKNNLPFDRGLEALTFFQEMQNGVTREYLLNHVEAVKKLLSDPKKKSEWDCKVQCKVRGKVEIYYKQRHYLQGGLSLFCG